METCLCRDGDTAAVSCQPGPHKYIKTNIFTQNWLTKNIFVLNSLNVVFKAIFFTTLNDSYPLKHLSEELSYTLLCSIIKLERFEGMCLLKKGIMTSEEEGFLHL